MASSSSTPSRSADPKLDAPATRSRSLSKSARVSQSIVSESVSRRPETPKAKRKSLSNRSVPYTSPALSRASQSRKSMVTTISNDPELNDQLTSSMIDVDDVNHSSEQNQLDRGRNAFERSSDDESQVSEFHIINVSFDSDSRSQVSNRIELIYFVSLCTILMLSERQRE